MIAYTMPYGCLCDSQAEILSSYIRGQIVHDLGAGDCTLSERLLELGARKVIAIDDRPMPIQSRENLEVVRTPFKKYLGPIEVAFLSWPINRYAPGLVSLLKRAPMVVYLGKNTDGSMCGTQPMFHHFIRRQVHRYAPHPKNVMIIYGRKFTSGRISRSPYQEELGALTTYMRGPQALECKLLPYSEDESAFGVRLD